MDSPLDELSIDVGTLIVAVLLLCSVAAAPPALELFVPGSTFELWFVSQRICDIGKVLERTVEASIDARDGSEGA